MTANSEHPTDLEHGDLPALGILKELDPKMRSRLSARGSLETLKPGTFVTHQGRHHHGLSVIIKGKLTVSCHAHGDYVPLAELGPGHTVGEMSLLDPQKSSADVCVVDEDSLAVDHGWRCLQSAGRIRSRSGMCRFPNAWTRTVSASSPEQ